MESRSTNKQRILIVDDDESIRTGLSDLLILEGYEVVTAGNGSIARHLYQSYLFDLIITDIIMPSTDGLRLILEIIDYDADAKILAISGGGRSGKLSLLETALKFGALKALSKPLSVEEVLSAVEEILSEGNKLEHE